MKKTKSELKSALGWKDKATFELTITIPKERIAAEYQITLKSLSKTVQLSGFRKGKAPASLVEEKLGKEEIYREIIKRVIPQAYQEALERNQLKPIIEPKVIIESAKEKEDWVIKITACITPEVELGKYKEEIRKINAAGKIWTPQKEGKEPNEKEKELEKEKRLQKILQRLIDLAVVQIPSLLVETERQQKLISLIDQLQKTGLTIDQYLASRGQTVDQLKEEMAAQISRDWKLELIMAKIADEEGIKVEENELKEVLEKQDKAKPSINAYLVAHILRRRKTLDYLTSL